MAATLRELRGRIRSAGSIKKITKAQEMIATSRIGKAQARLQAARPYAAEITKMLNQKYETFKEPYVGIRSDARFNLGSATTLPADVTVARQVLAEPDLDLASKTWARLIDGTPLVTAERRGRGWIVLVHTTANADWSNLALSGLFVEMLRRIEAMSQGVTEGGEEALAPIETLDGFGRLQRAPPTARPIPAAEIATALASPRHPPGFYGTTDTRRALNLSAGIPELKPVEGLPPETLSENFTAGRETDLRPPLLTAALFHDWWAAAGGARAEQQVNFFKNLALAGALLALAAAHRPRGA